MATKNTIHKVNDKTQVVTTEFVYRLPGGVLVTREEYLDYIESLRN